ncbi:MAG TPA: hypothetical protein VGG46_04100 [Terriglobales bacterium]|jgi:hypothetical protein
MNSNFFRRFFVEHKRLVTHSLFVALLAGYFCASAAAQVAVVLSPVPQLQFFDQTGTPLSFGCVFTYEVGTTTPLSTYTDYTGTTLNQNPVILSAGGSANIWLQAGQAYTFRVKSAGGFHCSSGQTLYTVNGIGGGSTTLTTIIPYSPTPAFPVQAQNQLFEITLTGDASAQLLTFVGVTPPSIVWFQITQDGSGGHTFSWPANSVGGCTIGSTANQVTTQEFVYNGTDATAVGPCVIGDGPEIDVGTIHASIFASACASPATLGVFRLCNADIINWRNSTDASNEGITIDANDRFVLNAAGGLETTGTVPDIFLGGVTASFPRLKRNGTAINFRLGDDSADAPITASRLGLSDVFTSTSSTVVALGPEVATPGSAPASATQEGYFVAGKGWCALDSSSKEYCTAANSGAGIAVQASSITTLGSDVSVSATTVTTVATKAVTMPSSGCPCRAFVSYEAGAQTSNSGGIEMWINDGTSNFSTGGMNTTGSVDMGGTQFHMTAGSYSPTTYANSATITFTWKVESEQAITVKQNSQFSPQGAWLNVAILTSN